MKWESIKILALPSAGEDGTEEGEEGAGKNRLPGNSFGAGSKPSHNTDRIIFTLQGKVGFNYVFHFCSRFCLNATLWRNRI